MADSLLIPQNVANIIDVEVNVTKKTEILTNFLTEMANEIADLKKRIEELEAQ